MEHSTTDKNKTSYTATTSPRSHKIALLDQAPPSLHFPQPASPWFCLFLPLASFCLSLSVFSTCIENDTAVAPSPSSFLTSRLWPPLLPGVCYCVCYWRPYNERARWRHRDSHRLALGTPASRLTNLLAPGSAQCAAWFTRISLCPPAVSISYVGFLS